MHLKGVQTVAEVFFDGDEPHEFSLRFDIPGMDPLDPLGFFLSEDMLLGVRIYTQERPDEPRKLFDLTAPTTRQNFLRQLGQELTAWPQVQECVRICIDGELELEMRMLAETYSLEKLLEDREYRMPRTTIAVHNLSIFGW